MSGRVARLWRRLFSSAQDLEDEQLAEEALKSGAAPLRTCSERARVVVRGTISSVTVNKQGGAGWLEAEVSDGTGAVTVIWMGRRTIPGIAVGHIVKIVGRLAKRGDGLVIYNPEYELLS